ncbi:MAG: ABC transporter permease [Planctomycetales bacterium]|nr:ABC transporter permease [Planctomycetales bacterium]
MSNILETELATSSSGSPLGATWMLAYREWIRFFRQRNRVIGALGQPIIFWLLFGTGMHSSFRSGNQDFMTYYLPGTLALIVLFTAIFTTISIIEDRREGFLQNVLVAPVPRWTIAAGKILGGGAIAWAQAIMFLLLALIFQGVPSASNLFGLLLLLALTSLALTAMGVFFAWPMESTQGFHAIMNLVLMPLWLLSGAFFPIPLTTASDSIGQWIMHWIMRLNPLSYSIAGLRHMLGATPVAEFWMPGLGTSWLVSIIFFGAMVLAAWRMVVRPQPGV